MKLSEQLNELLDHLYFYQHEQDFKNMILRVGLLEDALQDISTNYDCDEDAHKYHEAWQGPVVTNCRCCLAKSTLERSEEK